MDYAFKPTTNGRAVTAACAALEKPLRITRVAVGSGMVPENVNLADVHELYQYVAEGTISERRHEDDRLYLTVQYANSEHPEQPTFVLSEFIVYAEHPETGAETDLLYATLGDYRQPVPAYHPGIPGSVFNYPMVIVVSDEIEVEIAAAPGLVTQDQLEKALSEAAPIEAKEPPTPETEGQPGQHYFDAESGLEYVCKGTTTEGKYIWEETVSEDTVTRIVDEEIQKYQTGGIAKEIPFSIKPTDWKEGEGTYSFYADITDEDITEEHRPDAILDEESTDIASYYQVCATARSYEGYVRLRAKVQPEQEVSGTLYLLGKGGSGGSGYVLRPATPDRLGGIKIGNGMSAAPDGTTSVDTSGIAEDITGPVTEKVVTEASATDEQVDSMIDNVFGDDGEG